MTSPWADGSDPRGSAFRRTARASATLRNSSAPSKGSYPTPCRFVDGAVEDAPGAVAGGGLALQAEAEEGAEALLGVSVRRLHRGDVSDGKEDTAPRAATGASAPRSSSAWPSASNPSGGP